MIVDDELSRTFEHELSFTIINYHQLSCSLDMFKFDMIVHDSFFFRLTERMIVHDRFSVSGGDQGGLNTIWLPHCYRPVKNNKAIIWTNIRTTVTLKTRKWKKRKNLKTRQLEVEWLFDMQPNRRERGPAMFLEDFSRWLPQAACNWNNTGLKFNVREGITSVSNGPYRLNGP